MHQADTRKIADRPHILTSIGVWMALLMSAGSLWFAYSGFKLAEVANAASMQVEEISLRAPWRWNEWSTSSRATIPLKLKVRNFGKLTAQNLLVEVFPNIIVTRRPLVMSLGSTRATGFVSDNMPPGAASLPFEMDIPIAELRGHEAVGPSDVAGIMISAELSYSDASGKHEGRQCFYMPSDTHGLVRIGAAQPCGAMALLTVYTGQH